MKCASETEVTCLVYDCRACVLSEIRLNWRTWMLKRLLMTVFQTVIYVYVPPWLASTVRKVSFLCLAFYIWSCNRWIRFWDPEKHCFTVIKRLCITRFCSYTVVVEFSCCLVSWVSYVKQSKHATIFLVGDGSLSVMSRGSTIKNPQEPVLGQMRSFFKSFAFNWCASCVRDAFYLLAIANDDFSVQLLSTQ